MKCLRTEEEIMWDMFLDQAEKKLGLYHDGLERINRKERLLDKMEIVGLKNRIDFHLRRKDHYLNKIGSLTQKLEEISETCTETGEE